MTFCTWMIIDKLAHRFACQVAWGDGIDVWESAQRGHSRVKDFTRSDRSTSPQIYMPTNAKNTTNYSNFYLKLCDFVVVLALLFACEKLALSSIRLLNVDNKLVPVDLSPNVVDLIHLIHSFLWFEEYKSYYLRNLS